MQQQNTFRSFGECLRYYFYIASRPLAFAKLMLGIGFDPQFRERIMLAVTQVNKCSFCTWFHTREALRSGMDQDEIKALLSAEFDGAPEAQRPAILFAQHWAESHGAPDDGARRNFESQYTAHEIKNIYLSLYVISIGNYTGVFFERLFSKKKRSPADAAAPTTEKRP